MTEETKVLDITEFLDMLFVCTKRCKIVACRKEKKGLKRLLISEGAYDRMKEKPELILDMFDLYYRAHKLYEGKEKNKSTGKDVWNLCVTNVTKRKKTDFKELLD